MLRLGRDMPLQRQVALMIDVLRCAAWFEHVRAYLQDRVSISLQTPYAIGKFIQPHTYRGVSSSFSHNNLWAKYAAGMHRPSRATLAATEDKVPGSTAVFDAPLWAMLDVTHRAGSQIDEGLRTLCVEVQQCLYHRRSLRFGQYRRRTVGQAVLSSLECRATGLDSLAAAVLILKEASEAADSEQRFRVGMSLHRILLMTCMSHPVSTYRTPLIAYFSLFVFPMTTNGRLVIDLPFNEFHEMTYLLNDYVLILEDFGKIRCENDGFTRDRRRLLAGDFGMDLQFGFMPRLKVAPGCRDPSASGLVASQNIGKAWGLSVLRRYGAAQFPPTDVLLDMKAAYDGASAVDAT